MNTKHFLTAAVLVSGLFFATVNADAQRSRDDRDRRDYRDDRDYRGGRDRDYRGDRDRDYRGNNRNHRHYRPRVRVFAPPVGICIPPVPQRRYVRRHVPCAPPVCFAPPRRPHNHRWHR